MEVAYFRELLHTNQCELVFRLKIIKENSIVYEGTMRSVRQHCDSVESLLQHTINKINKVLGKDQESIEVTATLTKASSNVSDQIMCKNLIKRFCKPISRIQADNLILKVCQQSFVVVVNAPLINVIELPNVLFVGCSLQATKFKSLFTDIRLCKYVWFTSSNKEEWKEVGNNYKYTPTIQDLNKYVKLKCIPQNARVEGPVFEVISSSVVQEMYTIPKCPFEERHKYTQNRLNGSKFRIVSYNTLSRLYSDNIKFPYCALEHLSIEYRKQLILKELEGYHADIICLQELDCYIFKNYLKGHLPKHYKGVFHKKGKRVSEGLACFYNTSRFQLIDSIDIVIANELRSNALFKSISKLLELTKVLKDNILKQLTSLQLSVLLMNGTKNIIVVANTHLYYHSDASDIRLIQASIALDYISATVNVFKTRYSNIGIIFCGDFNSVPDSALYQFFTDGEICHTFEKDFETPLQDIHLKHPFQFESACGKPDFTNYTDFKGCLDYIFYDKTAFSLIDFVPFYEESILSENTAIPSKLFPSDHVALVANLQVS